MAALEPFGEPRTVKDAEMQEDWSKWCKVMDEEIGRLEDFQTWKLVIAPKDANVVGCHWVFRLKHDALGNIAKYRAHVVAKGYTQQFGTNYDETFAPVA